MNNKYKCMCHLVLLLCLSFLISGCSLTKSIFVPAQQTDTAKPSNGSFYIYYKDAEGNALSVANYQASSQTFDELLQELLSELKTSRSDDQLSTLGADVLFQTFSRGVDTVTIDVSSEYLGMSNTDQVLMRAAIVKTLLQLPGVTGIYLTVEGQSITNAAGEPVGMMNDGTFIEASSGGINSLQSIYLTLYFPSSDKYMLYPETKEVRYSTNLTVEQIVVEEMIKGPLTEEPVLAVTSQDTSINSIKMNDNCCVIDLGGKFNESIAGVDPELALYAIVNAVCSNGNAKSVQFLVDGESDVRFRGEISLNQIFIPRDELVQQETADN